MNNYHKPYLIISIIAVLLLAGLSFLSLDAIKRFSDPVLAQDNFLRFNGWLSRATPVAFLLLVGFSLFIYRKTGFSRFILLSNVIFIVFTLLDYVVLMENYFHFKQENGLWQGEFSIAGFFGIALCLIAIVLSSVAYFFVRWQNSRNPEL